MLSASAHKFNGPKGIGFLYIKKGTPIRSYSSGGAQEFGMRAGTENIASIVGMAVALKKNCDALTTNIKHVGSIETILINRLSEAELFFVRNGKNTLPGNISLSFPGFEGEIIMHRLDLMGIQISTGAACDSVNTKISHVLKAIKLSDDLAKGTVRISLGKSNTEIDAKLIAEALINLTQTR